MFPEQRPLTPAQQLDQYENLVRLANHDLRNLLTRIWLVAEKGRATSGLERPTVQYFLITVLAAERMRQVLDGCHFLWPFPAPPMATAAYRLALTRDLMRLIAAAFRHWLGRIACSSDLVDRPYRFGSEVEEMLQTIQLAAEQMHRVIGTSLQVEPPLVASLDTNIIARDVVDLHKSAARVKGIQLQFDPGSLLPPIRAEATHIYSASDNYLGNAVKFTPPGGRITVRTRKTTARVRLEVQDNGPGVPIIERHLLFVPNSGLSPKPTGGEASHGVGLALVKRLIESENGIVEAAFPPEGGSVFAFEVPAA